MARKTSSITVKTILELLAQPSELPTAGYGAIQAIQPFLGWTKPPPQAETPLPTEALFLFSSLAQEVAEKVTLIQSLETRLAGQAQVLKAKDQEILELRAREAARNRVDARQDFDAQLEEFGFFGSK